MRSLEGNRARSQYKNMNTQDKTKQRDRRRKRIRAKVFGTDSKPRFSVFRSNKYITAQLIDDAKGLTLASATSKNMKGKTALEKAKAAGVTEGMTGREALETMTWKASSSG